MLIFWNLQNIYMKYTCVVGKILREASYTISISIMYSKVFLYFVTAQG